MDLIKYEAACRALAECKSIDEASEIVNRAEALKAYARQARNRDLEIDARDIRLRAERRMGEIIIEIRKEKTFKAGRPRLIDDLGLSGTAAAGAQRLALMADRDFEAAVTDWRARAKRSRNVPTPLLSVRNPSQYVARSKSQSTDRKIDASDPLDGYRMLDGRAFADCLVGELNRLEALTRRQLLALKAIKNQMPIANPDQLAALRSVYREADLIGTLREIWDSEGAAPMMPDILNSLPSRRGGARQGSGRKCHVGSTAA